MSIHERLQLIQNQQGISQNAFAVRIGVTSQNFSKIMTNLSEPRASLLEAVVRVFGVSPRWLLLGEGDMYENAAAQNGAVMVQQHHSGTGNNKLNIADYRKELHQKELEVAGLQAQVALLKELLTNK